MQRQSSAEAALSGLEQRLDPLFAEREYRRFFEEAHAVRLRLRESALQPEARSRLYDRLNALVERAKARQEQEFRQRRVDDRARWSEQLARAEAYVAALHEEIGALLARDGDRAARARWADRARQKEERLRAVEATVTDLRRKLAETASVPERRTGVNDGRATTSTAATRRTDRPARR